MTTASSAVLRAASVASVLVFVASSTFAQAPDSATLGAATVQPVRFEENRGQADRRVRYISRARDYTVALTADEALLLVRKPALSPPAQLRASDLALVRMRLAGASPSPRITGTDPLPGSVYFADSDTRGSLTPIHTFARVEYADVYPGVDLVYYGNDHQLEFDFVVAPFADPDRIALSLDGVDKLTLNEAGDLSMRAGGADVTLKKPFVYQERDGRRIEVSGAYLLPADQTNTVRFRLGRFDPSLPLVIDPTWLTVFGSTDEDLASGLVVDSAGHTRLLGTTFDPATFPFTQLESGVLPPPNCFLTKSDHATGLRLYTILFANTTACRTLALSPDDVAYFTGYVSPNTFPNDQGTTVTMVDDSGGTPLVSRFDVLNYDSSALGQGVDALAVNGFGHAFLLGPCRSVGPGDPPLQLSGYNEVADAPDGVFDEGCAPPGPGLSERRQPVLTVVDSEGQFLYGSFLSPGELAGKYGLAVDAVDRAYIVGASSTTVSPTPDAYRSVCPQVARPTASCGYLMVLDTTAVGPASLTYASYLWNTEGAATVAVRLGPAGQLLVASEGQIFSDFPSNRPTDSSGWPYSLYPTLTEGIQVARFDRDTTDQPNQLTFATIFDPSRAVAALAGLTVHDQLADLRLFPSGAPAIASIAHPQGLAPMGIVTTFDRDGDRVADVWVRNLGTLTPPSFAMAAGPASVYLAGQVDSSGGQDTDIFVEQIDAADPTSNEPPTVRILESISTGGGPLTIFADAPGAGALLQLNAITDDPEGDTLTYSWSGPFTDNPVTTNSFISARVGLGMQQVVTLTVDDGHGNVVSIEQLIDVVGTPFVGTSATPVDSTYNGLVFRYAPLTVTATGIGAGGGNAYLHTRLDQIPSIPAHLQAGSPPIYFDVSADAVLVAPFSICIDTRGMSFANGAGIRLYHSQQSGPLGSWVDVTSPGYPQGQQVCGQTGTLGTFAVFYSQVPATAVQTIAGNGIREGSIDGPGGDPADDFHSGPALATPLNYLFGGALDRVNNHFFVSAGNYLLRLNLNDHTIARVAGNGVALLGSIDGPGGDLRDDLVEGGDAFNTFLGNPAELALAPNGDVVFFDRSTCRVRRLDVAQGRLFAVAGNGLCGYSGDGASAALASLWQGAMAFDPAGHLFIADRSTARVRRIDAATNLIDTIAGDGTFGTPAHGSPARSSISLPLGIAFDAQGHLLIAGGLHLLRISTGANALVDGDANETITVVGGCNTNCQAPFNGDGLAIVHPQVYLSGMGHITVAQDGSILLSDSFRVRRIVPGADGIVTGAADEIISTIAGYYDAATLSLIPNFNGDTFATQALFSHSLFPFDDLQGGIIVVDSNNARVRRFGLAPQPTDPNSADLAVTVTASPDPVALNASLRYDVGVTNNGPAAATGVTLTYEIPAGAVFESVTSGGQVTCTAPAAGSAGTVTCDLGAVASGASATVAIDIRPLAAGTVSSTFTVAGVEADPNGGNNSSAVSTVVSLGPVVIDITEVVTVIDSTTVLPAVMIGVSEPVTVTDAVQIPIDNVPPVLTVPGTIVSEAQSPAGAVVTFAATASDNEPGTVTVVCLPQSGSVFAFNGSSPSTTTVSCTATDASGNTATASFDVIVQDTTPPQVLTSPITIAATEAAGARGNVPQAPHTPILQQLPLLAGAIDAADPNPVRLPVQWVSCANPAQVLGSIGDATLYPVGPNCFSYVFTDASGNAGAGILTLTVSAPIGGHINAPNVPVTATDSSNVPLPVTATFLTLDQPGLLTALPPQFVPPAPTGFTLVGPPLELYSTALAPHAVVVCMAIPAGELADRVLLLDQGQWTDRTDTTNAAAGEVCSFPGPVGTYALALPPLTLTLTPQSATADITQTHAVEARLSDQSDPESRVTFTANAPMIVEIRDPQTADAPLSVSVHSDPVSNLTQLIVSLATNASGQVITTASHLAAAINASPGALASAGTWPGTAGAGIVAPSAPSLLTRLRVGHPSLSGGAPIYISAPGRVLLNVSGTVVQTDSITAHLDLDDDGVIDSGELTAAAEVTWVDLTPPVLTLPANITVTATGVAGAPVPYVVTAVDAISGPVIPSCTPPSGATFAVGSTSVNCSAADASGNLASGSFTVTVLPFVSVPPIIASLTPPTAIAGSAGVTIDISGSGFASGATALWNGSPRPTVVNSPTQVTVTIPPADLASTAYLTTALIAVANPGASASAPLPFLVVSGAVISANAAIAMPGQSVTVTNAPNQPAQHGVSATLTNGDPASAPATVAVASYASNPVSGVVFFAGRFFDIQVTGADAADSLNARFYYPSTVVGLAELRLRLWYWNGTAWRRVLGAGGVLPSKNTANNLDGTISGGRFTVTLDATSAPAITDLGGTVFALVEEEDGVAPVTTLEQTPGPNAHGWNNTDVAVTLAATDDLTGVAQTQFSINGGGWQIYSGPIVLRQSGFYVLAYRSIDEEGNVEQTKSATVKIDKVDPVAIVIALPPLLWPVNGRMVDVTVLPVMVDLFSGVDKLTLVSVSSNDPGMTPDDVSGWSIGTQDTTGKLRAEPRASGDQRIYSLTYRVTDRAGNEVLTTALVVVPRTRLRW